MKINKQLAQERKRKGFTLVELLVVIAIISTLGALAFGPIMSRIEAAEKTEAMSNGKNLHIALLSFATENGNTFPSKSTSRDGSVVDSPEAAFQQIIDSGHVKEEKYFWNKANGRGLICSIDSPDNDGTLTAGENAWGYTKNLSIGGDGGAPLIYDSCKSVSTNTASFTTLPWKGQAIIIKVDASCEAYNISYTGNGALTDTGGEKLGSVDVNSGSSGKVDIFSIVPAYAEALATSGGS